ncbi:hypothetical protein GE21DRAFT_5527 [Neurospora crassa]|uniref:Uncharacterized protein n=1 Tax=Neurospora crassa (strain ATCC 24698 / 74-OR23-1A / CBS 708.71 / DSM 1257 / FGSC 987) TaxID=367110 RepID=Q7S826_NEUCR|nr:hypothetical protein NCU06514 [Neurospora crassa OR74A]EAA32489.1 hypothetical protein NCU06514 [Neurospora crassa OR74A]KHE78263.1 hypothetical protein GE21DRAFT_5527 [Neurospora crassa]|eukprot:XP_961725.1 hypothetical protein NCU06514 [Neurospora crassa OR74A]
MATPNYTPEQISALRALRDRLRSAQYTWEVRQLLKNAANATGLKQLQLVQWQDGDNNRKNLLHFLVDERLEKVAILLIEVFWSRKEEDQKQLMRIIRYPKCYIDSPEGSGGEYTVERLAEGRNCEQLVDLISRFRELCPPDTREEADEEEHEEETEEERASATERMRRLQRLSTPIPRTPSPPSPTSSNGSLEPANFSPLHVFTTKKKTPLNLHAARPVSSSPRSTPPRSTPPLARGGSPVEITIWSSPPLPSPSPAVIQTPILLRGSGQPSTPPPLFIPSSTPPPAPGAPDTPLWYPPSEHSEPEPGLDPEREEQRARIQRPSAPPPPGSFVPAPPERTPEPVTPVRLLLVSADFLSPFWGINGFMRLILMRQMVV